MSCHPLSLHSLQTRPFKLQRLLHPVRQWFGRQRRRRRLAGAVDLSHGSIHRRSRSEELSQTTGRHVGLVNLGASSGLPTPNALSIKFSIQSLLGTSLTVADGLLTPAVSGQLELIDILPVDVLMTL